MRQVAHPEKLFIQINDESPNILGFSFNDDETNPEGLDPNAFDEDTLPDLMTDTEDYGNIDINEGPTLFGEDDLGEGLGAGEE